MVYIILGEGFEEIEAIAPADILRRGKIDAKYVGIGGLEVRGAHGITLKADLLPEEMELSQMDMLVLPGGNDGVAAIEGCESVMRALDFAIENGRFVGAICAAPTILGKRGLLRGKKATCYPQMEPLLEGAQLQQGAAAVRDGRIITGRAPAAALEFGLALLEALTDSSMEKTVEYFLAYNR